jgi:hypothetical protein
MNEKPSILKQVEKQTHKSYGDLTEGKHRAVIHNLILKLWGLKR